MPAHIKSPAAEGAALAALGMARGRPLPVEARGLTKSEVTAMHVKKALIVFGSFVALASLVLFGVSTESGRANESMLRDLAVAFPVMGAVLALALAVVVLWIRSQAIPGITVTVDPHEVRIAAEGQEHRLPHDRLDFTVASWKSIRGPSFFAGVRLESPTGPVPLTDRWFDGGATAAAAIVHQADLRGLLWPPEQP